MRFARKLLDATAYVLLMLALIAAWPNWAKATPASWYNTAWVYRRLITIDHLKVSNSSQVDFPVLFSAVDPDFRDIFSGGHVGKANGGDILFTSSDGLTKLSHEIEKYDGATGELTAWIKIPFLSAATDTVIYAYYDNKFAPDQWNKNATWESNFRMVQHLNETGATHYDSTVNANNGSPQNGVVQGTTGKIDGAVVLDGTNDYIEVPDSPSISPTAAITVSAWAFQSSLATDKAMVAKWTYATQGAWGMQTHNAFPSSLRVFIAGSLTDPGGSSGWTPIGSWTAGVWHHVVFVHNGALPAAERLKVYIDGAPQTLGMTAMPALIQDSSAPLRIGDFQNLSRFWNGRLDEVQVSAVPRTADWIKTSYNNQSSPSTFYSLGGPQPRWAPATGVNKSFVVVTAVASLLLSLLFLRLPGKIGPGRSARSSRIFI